MDFHEINEDAPKSPTKIRKTYSVVEESPPALRRGTLRKASILNKLDSLPVQMKKRPSINNQFGYEPSGQANII